MTGGTAWPLFAAGGLADLDAGLFWWTLVLFVVFATILGKFGWKPLLATIEARETSVRSAVEGAAKANAEALVLLEKHKEMIRDATREREDILKRAVQEADQIKADLVTRARSEGDQLIQRARQEIERDKARVVQELRAQVVDLAMDAASKIVASSLTPEAQRKLVDEFITALPGAR